MTNLLSLGRFLPKKDKPCDHCVIVIDRVRRIVICEKCLEELDPLEMLARCGGASARGTTAVQPETDSDEDVPSKCATVHYLRPKG